ncbi:MAG: hypothetical protein COZ96_00825 [Nitrospirae bacterium CG_4_8_14_3_um_filter_70_85]|nr:MAG: hypothetical protein COZ96_00825 [Nitrospirae bacterium CG_4_8_14_3_um_filter_70_85]
MSRSTAASARGQDSWAKVRGPFSSPRPTSATSATSATGATGATSATGATGATGATSKSASGTAPARARDHRQGPPDSEPPFANPPDPSGAGGSRHRRGYGSPPCP